LPWPTYYIIATAEASAISRGPSNRYGLRVMGPTTELYSRTAAARVFGAESEGAASFSAPTF